jgi:Na+/H+ antiporter NhaD/arsenite permease-like protein
MKRIAPACAVNLVLIAALFANCPDLIAGPLDAELIVQGQLTDTKGTPLADADVTVLLDGRPLPLSPTHSATPHHGDGSKTGYGGVFLVKTHAPPSEIESGRLAVKFHRVGFTDSKPIAVNPIREAPRVDSQGPLSTEKTDGAATAEKFSARVEASLDRRTGMPFWIALAVLVGVYALISLELVHRTLAAMLGAALILAVTHTIGSFDEGFRVLTFEQSIKAVDWNVIFLLMGMMIIVGALKESGVFQWTAYKAFHLSGGRVFPMVAALCVVTAVLSAFLDNVTTMLLLTPVCIELSLVLGISPFAILVPEIMASNLGGTATLIGDPPNIMIGSYAGLTFNDFVAHLTPVVIVCIMLQALYTKWYYGAEYRKALVKDVPEMIEFLRNKYRITDMRLLCVGGSLLIGVIVLFILHGFFHMEVSVAALLGAACVLLCTGADPVEIFERDVEWPSLVFFIMLFVVVGAAEETGILAYIADWIGRVCGSNLVFAILLTLWTSALLSAIVDNIPFTATMLPVVALLNKTIPGADSGILWWALALGACFGGNGTIIGASANVITVGLAERSGHHITFFEFLKHGAPLTLITLAVSSLYLIFVMK